MPNNRDYYAILGVRQNANQSEIEAAYRQLVGSYRPESSQRRPLNQRHDDIVEAYETLKDPRARRKYDRRRGVNARSFRSVALIAAGLGIVIAAGVVVVVLVAKGGGGSSTTVNLSATPRSPTPTRVHTPTPVGQTPAPTPPPSPPAISAPFVTTASGLQIATIIQGTGAPPQAHNSVTVNYTGWVQGGRLFDSSLSPRRSPYTFVLGENKVIKAWDEAVAQMQVGGLYRIIAPPDLAYGAAGSLPVVPPNATLVYDISLLDTGQASASATQTAAATPIGTDNGLCKATASMSLPAPPSPNYSQVVTGVLTCNNGIAPTGAIMHAVWHEQSADKTCDGTADATGTASCSRQIGTLTSGYKVVIDVTFELNGAAYATTTSFTPT